MRALLIVAALLLIGCDPDAGAKQQDKRAIKLCEELAIKQGSPKSHCDGLREKYKERWGEYPSNT